jgi:hypothetical protein
MIYGKDIYPPLLLPGGECTPPNWRMRPLVPLSYSITIVSLYFLIIIPALIHWLLPITDAPGYYAASIVYFSFKALLAALSALSLFSGLKARGYRNITPTGFELHHFPHSYSNSRSVTFSTLCDLCRKPALTLTSPQQSKNPNSDFTPKTHTTDY